MMSSLTSAVSVMPAPSGPGEVNAVEVTGPVRYPAPVEGMLFVLQLRACESTLARSRLLSALRSQEVIAGDVVGTAASSSTTFLVSRARTGHYDIRLGADRCVAHIVKYEVSHAGHLGCFAAGYPYFLCGATGEVISRVVLRACSWDFPVVVSRSHSADCETVFRRKAPVVPRTQLAASRDCCPCPYGQSSTKLSYFDAASSYQASVQLRDQAGLFFATPAGAAMLDVRCAPCARCGGSMAREVKSLVDSVERPRSTSGAPPSSICENDKYFAQRFRLVSKYEASLNLSETAWFSICPEVVAKHIASRVVALSRKLGRKIRVFDPFCGAGGNIVQAALMDEVSHAFASDIDAAEVRCAQRMAQLYGVPTSKMSFRVSDVFALSPGQFKTPVDAIICSPPWGGPAYLTGVYDVTSMTPDFVKLLRHCASFTKNLALLMPRSVAVDQLVDTARQAGIYDGVELELNFVARKAKTATVYYGELVNGHL